MLKIFDRLLPPTVLASSTLVGEMFKYAGNCYLRIEATTTIYIKIYGDMNAGDYMLCVALNTFQLAAIHRETMVEPVLGELHIGARK